MDNDLVLAIQRLREALEDAERFESSGVMVKCTDLRTVLEKVSHVVP